MLSRIRSQLPDYRRALRRRRRTLSVLLLAAAAVLVVPSVLPAVLPGAQRSSTLMVTTADVPAGTTLTEEHLQPVEVAAQLVPAGAPATSQELVGRTTSLPLEAGTPVLPGMLEGATAPTLVPGQALLVVTAPSPLRDRLHPGTLLEIHHSTRDPARPGRTAATVVEVAPDAPGSPTAFGQSDSMLVVLVTVARADAGDIAHATREGWSSVSIVG